MPPSPRFTWSVVASRAVARPDGAVRLECTVRRNGVAVGTLVLLGVSQVAEASDLAPWWFPVGEGG